MTQMNFSTKKLLWTEGTLLAQQHFQQWDLLQESRHQFWYFFHTKRPRSGFLSIDIETTLLGFGTFRLNHFQAISKEGKTLGFKMNLNEGKLLELDLNQVEWLNKPVQGTVLSIYIATPKGSNSHGVSGYPKNNIRKSRWVAEYRGCVDEMDSDRQQEILFGNLNVYLLIDSSVEFQEKQSENDLLMIAKIIYLGNDHYVCQKAFMPEILRLGASFWLVTELKNLKSYLQGVEKSLMLRVQDIKTLRSNLQYDENPMLTEWRTGEFIKSVSLLIHHISLWLANPNTDPDEVMDVIRQSIIVIQSISLQFDGIKSESLTEMNDRHDIFTTLFEQLKNAIQSIFPRMKKNIILIHDSESWISSEFLDEKILNNSDLYLSVDLSECAHSAEQFMREIKLCGLKNIQRIITQALPGIPIEVCLGDFDLPLGDRKRTYFRISQAGEYWDDVKGSGKLCIFVSKLFLNIDIQCFSLLHHNKDC